MVFNLISSKQDQCRVKLWSHCLALCRLPPGLLTQLSALNNYKQECMPSNSCDRGLKQLTMLAAFVSHGWGHKHMLLWKCPLSLHTDLLGNDKLCYKMCENSVKHLAQLSWIHSFQNQLGEKVLGCVFSSHIPPCEEHTGALEFFRHEQHKMY